MNVIGVLSSLPVVMGHRKMLLPVVKARTRHEEPTRKQSKGVALGESGRGKARKTRHIQQINTEVQLKVMGNPIKNGSFSRLPVLS